MDRDGVPDAQLVPVHVALRRSNVEQHVHSLDKSAWALHDQPPQKVWGSGGRQFRYEIDLWLGGHTHTNPDDAMGGRTHIERKWDVNFINCAALTRYHGAALSFPMSRLLTFTEGSNEARVQCYLHTSRHAPQGWYEKAERTIRLSKPFQFV